MILNDDLQKPQMIASSLFKHSRADMSPHCDHCARGSQEAYLQEVLLPSFAPADRSTRTRMDGCWTPMDARGGVDLDKLLDMSNQDPSIFFFFNRGVKRYVMVIAIQDVPIFKY